MHFADLTPFTYRGSEASASVLNVGWLGEGHAFPVATPRQEFVSALRALVANPVNLCRGQHQCEFCPAPSPEMRNGMKWNTAPAEILGNGEIHVPGEGGLTYVAPVLVRHYVEVHRYAPPPGFVQACLAHSTRPSGGSVFRCIVLDAMGVLFEAADDVAELLVPFVQAANPATSSHDVEAAYLAASLGDLDADAFWQRLGLDPKVEDLYLEGHSMVPGAISFLQAARHAGVPVWCLSNDVERWSLKLRENFRIESYLEGAVISSAARARKPSPEIYRLLLERSGYSAGEVIFVDDRQKNVVGARELGISALQFSQDLGYEALKRQLLDGEDASAR